MSDIVWSYRDSEWAEDHDLVGYDVEGEDGSLGKVDQATADTDGAWLVVDTGFWIFGKKRVIPAGTVVGMDHEGQRIIVNVSKDQVKEAPDYDEDTWDQQARGLHAEHYTQRTGHENREDLPGGSWSTGEGAGGNVGER
ncbi:PRC-barrel domain-containing protein [Nocardioides sp. S-58]|uniref:PRC-barrel domain-containing protein n=1 Tax=Nocardioides renjunii TaxID=3095075 RepID=A0ABU5K8H3_9ACTN|nr:MULTISPECIES: PRC-barrel domain-containing protein [unclassified Nocardioides]MDZ5661272.1 PRC-barrel domain-containing protein [Nocardioides sp. S-58]WQQ22275.1 PRC-barrel domain-containing protein [Nocardioides sp. S-34]